MKTWVLARRQSVPCPLEDVFAFFADAANLERLTPPFLDFKILTPMPVVMETGTLLDYRIGLFGIPLRWRTRIEAFDPPHSFVDVQLKGPYASWRHTHTFTQVPGGTELHDRVEYAIPLGPLGNVAQELFVRRTLRTIFDFRRDAAATIFRPGYRGGSTAGASEDAALGT